MKTTNIVSMSGGKDSTATVLLAIEREVENLQCVFADTGNEHAQTYEYLDYLDTVLPVTIRRVKGDFAEKLLINGNLLRKIGPAIYTMVSLRTTTSPTRRPR